MATLCLTHFTFAQEQFSYDLPIEKQQAISRKIITMQLPQQSKASKIDVDVVGNTMFFQEDIAIREQPKAKAKALGIKGDNYRCANSVVAYTIADGHPRVELIKRAIEHINAKTNICVVPRSKEKTLCIIELCCQENTPYSGMIPANAGICTNKIKSDKSYKILKEKFT